MAATETRRLSFLPITVHRSPFTPANRPVDHPVGFALASRTAPERSLERRMAEIRVEPQRGGRGWVWLLVLLLIIVAVAIWYFATQRGSGTGTSAAPSPSAPAAAPATKAP